METDRALSVARSDDLIFAAQIVTVMRDIQPAAVRGAKIRLITVMAGGEPRIAAFILADKLNDFGSPFNVARCGKFRRIRIVYDQCRVRGGGTLGQEPRRIGVGGSSAIDDQPFAIIA